MSLKPSTSRDRALKQTLNLVNLTRDIERNQEDTIFQIEEGGRIDYIFDANIFELLIRPKHMSKYASAFQSSQWLLPQYYSRSMSDEFMAQSAMICAEFLFSGHLPGQDKGSIYISKWHRSELYGRIEKLRQDLGATRWSGNDLEDLLDLLKDRIAIGADSGLGESVPTEATDRVPLLRMDFEALRRRPGVTSTDLNHFIVTRLAARSLAIDEIVEPLEQILRIVSRNKIGGRLLSASSLATPVGQEQALIDKDAAFWATKLEEELSMGSRSGGSQRLEENLQNDADSLALVRWLSKKLGNKRRKIVLVTGDSHLFDAYRRWYKDLSAETEEYYEPFVLRRPAQYAPILNLNDIPGGFVDARDLFIGIRSAVESALLPFSVSSMTDAEPKQYEHSGRMRDHFALKLSASGRLTMDPEMEHFANSLKPDWLEQHRLRLRNVHESWLTAERMAIGAMFEMVSARMDDHELDLARDIAPLGDEAASRILNSHLSELVNKIVKDSVEIWLPLAGEFISGEINKSTRHLTEMKVRPPIAVRLATSEGGLYDLLDLVDEWRLGRQSARNRLLQSAASGHPALIFAAAATLALTLGNWSDAERFSELALRAEIGGLEFEALDHDGFELQYLHALAKRFRMGEVGVPASESAVRALDRNFDVALRLLDSCESYHGVIRADLENRLCLLRTLSERAALRLFKAEAIGLALKSDNGAELVSRVELEILLASAERDLKQCLKLDRELRRERLDEEFEGFISLVRRQFFTNFAAHDALEKMLSGKATSGDPKRVADAGEIIDVLVGMALESSHEWPEVVQAEVLIFVSEYKELPTRLSDQLRLLMEAAPSINLLPIDRAILLFCQDVYRNW